MTEIQLRDYSAVFLCSGEVIRSNDGAFEVDIAGTPHRLEYLHDVEATLGVRPIGLELGAQNGRLLVPYWGGRFLEITQSELALDAGLRGDYSNAAALFRLWKVVDAAADTVAAFVHSRLPTALPDGGVNRSQEFFFEFEALIAQVVRSFNHLRYRLWSWAGKAGNCPRSFLHTFRSLEQEMPQSPALTRAVAVLRIMREYRDCMEHYVDVGVRSWGRVSKDSLGRWQFIATMPDNPKARSLSKFTFVQRKDAVDEAWKAVSAYIAVTAHLYGRDDLNGGSCLSRG